MPAGASARLEGVNKPELLPPGPMTPVIDVAGFLTEGEVRRAGLLCCVCSCDGLRRAGALPWVRATSRLHCQCSAAAPPDRRRRRRRDCRAQEARIRQRVEALEADTGMKLRVLAQNYPQTPGLAIKDYWVRGWVGGRQWLGGVWARGRVGWVDARASGSGWAVCPQLHLRCISALSATPPAPASHPPARTHTHLCDCTPQGVDADTVVFVADPNTGNILNFNVGENVDLRVPRVRSWCAGCDAIDAIDVTVAGSGRERRLVAGRGAAGGCWRLHGPFT